MCKGFGVGGVGRREICKKQIISKKNHHKPRKKKKNTPKFDSPIVYGGILFGSLGGASGVPVVCWSFPVCAGTLQCTAGIGKASAIVLNCTWAAQAWVVWAAGY